MLRRNSSLGLGLLTLALLTLGALTTLSARADILKLKDGSRVETQGPWKVEGAMVIFTTTDGRLASLQAKTVDLDASKAATEEAARQAAQAAEEAKAKPAEVKPVLVLTDADVAHVGPEGEAETGNEPPQEKSGRLLVTSWQRGGGPGGEGVTITGRVTNQSQDAVGDITVNVDLYNADGRRLGSTSAGVSPSSLLPGTSGNFRATLSDVPDFVSARFNVESTALETAPAAPATIPQVQYEQMQEQGQTEEQPAAEQAGADQSADDQTAEDQSADQSSDQQPQDEPAPEDQGSDNGDGQ